VLPVPLVVVTGGLVFADDEQPVSSAIAMPAPATAIPFNNDRRVTGVVDAAPGFSPSGECMGTVYRAPPTSARPVHRSLA
jgi:hypothetical protein